MNGIPTASFKHLLTNTQQKILQLWPNYNRNSSSPKPSSVDYHILFFTANDSFRKTHPENFSPSLWTKYSTTSEMPLATTDAKNASTIGSTFAFLAKPISRQIARRFTRRNSQPPVFSYSPHSLQVFCYLFIIDAGQYCTVIFTIGTATWYTY